MPQSWACWSRSITGVRGALFALALVIACRERAATTGRVDSSGPLNPARELPPQRQVRAPSDTSAPQHGTWDAAMIETRLRAAGLSPTPVAEAVRQPFMRIPGTLFRFGRGEIQAFVYSDQVVRALDTDKLDPVRVAPPTMMVSWRHPATLVVDANLAVIILTDDPSLRDRIRNALTSDQAHDRR